MYASNLHLRIHSNDALVEAGEYAVQYLFPANLLDLQAAAFAAVDKTASNRFVKKSYYYPKT